MFIHHATRKLAAKSGIELEITGVEGKERVEARKINSTTVLAFDVDAKTALEKAIQRLKTGAKPEPVKTVPGTYAAMTGKRSIRAIKTKTVKPSKPTDLPSGTKGAPKTFPVLGSIVKRDYRKRYGSSQNCGDELAIALKGYCKEPTGRGNQTRLNVVKLEQVARANDVWEDRYGELNIGQYRMTIGVRLRGLLRKGTSVVVGDTVIKGNVT